MKKILLLENLPFQSHIKVGSHHYAELFAKENKVLWVSLPWHIFQILKDRKSDRIKNWNWNKPLKINENLTAITPFIALPYRNNTGLKSNWYLNHLHYFMPNLIKTINSLGYDKPDLVWFTDPRHISALKYIKPLKIAYRCVDNLEHFADVPPKLIDIEKALISKCDHVFFTSKDLKNKYDKINPQNTYLPNGCNLNDFNSEFPDINIPEKIQNLFQHEKTNFLYIGAIAEWFDFEAIRIMSDFKDINIVIVGPLRINIPEDLLNRRNINFSGPYPYKYMPIFTKLADIGIIPFQINSLTDSVNPIKLYEYCAAGLTVITSAFKTVKEINGPFHKYSNKEELLQCLQIITSQKMKYSICEIIEFAKLNTWENRYETIKEKLEI